MTSVDMSSKRGGRAPMEGASASQTSILSFFGTGSGSTRSPAASPPPPAAPSTAPAGGTGRRRHKRKPVMKSDRSESAKAESNSSTRSGVATCVSTIPKAARTRKAGPTAAVAAAAAAVDLREESVATAATAAAQAASKGLASASAATSSISRGSPPRMMTAATAAAAAASHRGADDEAPAAADAGIAIAVASTTCTSATTDGKRDGVTLCTEKQGLPDSSSSTSSTGTQSPQTDREDSPSSVSRKRPPGRAGGAVAEAAGQQLTKRIRSAGTPPLASSREGPAATQGMSSAGPDGGDCAAPDEGGHEEEQEEEEGCKVGWLSGETTEEKNAALPRSSGGGGARADDARGETDGEGESSDGERPGDSGDGGRRAKVVCSEEEEEKEEEEKEEKEEKEEEEMVDGGISQYELQRLERIKRNQAFMATLGLASPKPPAVSSLSGTAAAASSTSAGSGKPRNNKKRSRPVGRTREKTPALPVRRSARARGVEAVDYNEDKQAKDAITAAARGEAAAAAAAAKREAEPVLEEIDFDDSSVLKYLCGREASGSDSSSEATAVAAAARKGALPKEGARIVGLRVLEPFRPLSASGLSAIYTMNFCGAGAAGGGNGGGVGTGAAPPLLAAGGKGGIVALFSTQQQQPRQQQSSRPSQGGSGAHERQQEEEEEGGEERTLMNFKAHKGWVSAVKFLDGGLAGGRRCRLLSSANDSVVKLWDASKQHRGTPRLLCTVSDLHHTRKGIFSMDSNGTRVATGSKDTTVALASLRTTGLEGDRVLGDPNGCAAFHEKVVKGVSLRDENTVASCGDDSNVRVCDLRSRAQFGISHSLQGAHDGAPCHTVRWHPLDAHLLLTAGLDSTVKLHDLRRLDVAAPVHVFRGHCPYALARPRSIHRPEFLVAEAGAAGGAGNDDSARRVNIITCGERSDKLSMYDSGTGATVSRGVLGDEATALAVSGSGDGGWLKASSTGAGGGIAAALPGGSVVLLEPVWG